MATPKSTARNIARNEGIGEFVYRRACFRFREPRLQLVEKRPRALGASPINVLPQLLDFELQMRDQRIVLVGCDRGVGQVRLRPPSSARAASSAAFSVSIETSGGRTDRRPRIT